MYTPTRGNYKKEEFAHLQHEVSAPNDGMRIAQQGNLLHLPLHRLVATHGSQVRFNTARKLKDPAKTFSQSWLQLTDEDLLLEPIG